MSWVHPALRRALLLFSLLPMACAAEDRLWIETKFNHAPAKIFLDTGASEFYLFRPAAIRLGFKVSPESSEPWRMYRASKLGHVESLPFTGKVRPVIVHLPDHVPPQEMDGFVGWKTVRDNIVAFDAARLQVSFPKELPPGIESWTRLKVRKGRILVLELPNRDWIIVDTGSSTGLGIPAEAWKKWAESHPDQKATKITSSTPAAGVINRLQTFAPEFALGPLTLSDVLIEETDPWSESMARGRHAATLGLAALARIDLVVDGKNGAAYLRAKPPSSTAPGR